MKKILSQLPEWRPDIDAMVLGWLLIVGWLVLLAFALPAAAQVADSALRQACSADVRSVCAGIMPGGGRIKTCMMEKRDQLSQGCKDAIASAHAKAPAK